MNREQKEKEVAWLHNEFDGVKAVFLTNFQGLNVKGINELRNELRSKDAKFKVLKNTLALLASRDTDAAVLADDMVYTRAAAWTRDEDRVQAIAKVLIDFAKTHPKLELISGVFGGKRFGAEDFEPLSKLQSREELLARLLGAMNAPISSFVGVLAAVPRSLLNVLKAIEEKKGSSSAAS